MKISCMFVMYFITRDLKAHAHLQYRQVQMRKYPKAGEERTPAHFSFTCHELNWSCSVFVLRPPRGY